MKDRNTIDFLGVHVEVLDTNGLCERVLELASEGRRRKIMYVNADCMLISIKDSKYRGVLGRADLVYADGVGVVLGAKLWGHQLPGRSTGADFMPEFCKEFARLGLSIYLLGGTEGVAEEAAQRLLHKVPDLKVAGTHHGYFKREESMQIIEKINSVDPDLVLVGFGAPYQERWIDEYAEKLEVPVLWGVGGLFDFISGRTWRGPQWMLDNGFEWLCRLIAEPARLWNRYLVGNAKFLVYLMWYRYFMPKTFSK